MIDLEELLTRYRVERGGSVRETAAGVEQLSAMFNGLVPHRPGYFASSRLRRAYVQYYLPVHAAKVARVLDELERLSPPGGKPPRVLDFGCGPGTASIALLLRRPVEELHLVDTVDEALEDAASFAQRLGARPVTGHESPEGPFDLIFAVNVLSETPAQLEELLADDGYLVAIEPALKTATRKLMEWRDGLVARGFRIAAPCPGPARCPMLEHPDLWCHQDIGWNRPSFVAAVDRRVNLLKESLKYSYVVVTRNGRALEDLGRVRRLVSNLHREKGKAWGWLCGPEGPLCRAEMLTRSRSAETEAFFRARRGNVLELEAAGASCRVSGSVRKIF